ncbi:MAG: hypothetical protein ABSE73_18960 [Planctomycetota bacterium]
MSLPAADYGLMQSRVFAAPRADLGRAALDWFRAQAGIWRALPPIPEEQKPQLMTVPEDILPLPDGWTLKVEGQPDRTVRLGVFGTLGLPENTIVTFERTVAIPTAWKGRRLQLVFDAEHWFWGILPSAKLLVNGKEGALRQPIKPEAQPSFAVDVTEAAAAGTLTIRLEIDGVKASTLRKEKTGQFKPHGVTGLFYLQAIPPAVKVEPLPGAWQAASAFGRLAPVKADKKTQCVYLETRFTIPKDWPAKRLFLESPTHLGFLLLNGYALQTPAWMKRLDVSGMVRRDGGENVLRWVPESRQCPAWNRSYQGAVPALTLAWTE